LQLNIDESLPFLGYRDTQWLDHIHNQVETRKTIRCSSDQSAVQESLVDSFFFAETSLDSRGGFGMELSS
jgi:hypothetical protein